MGTIIHLIFGGKTAKGTYRFSAGGSSGDSLWSGEIEFGPDNPDFDAIRWVVNHKTLFKSLVSTEELQHLATLLRKCPNLRPSDLPAKGCGLIGLEDVPLETFFAMHKALRAGDWEFQADGEFGELPKEYVILGTQRQYRICFTYSPITLTAYQRVPGSVEEVVYSANLTPANFHQEIARAVALLRR